MNASDVALNERSRERHTIQEERRLMRLLVELEGGACMPCFRRLTGLPPHDLEATLDTLGTQIKIFAEDERCQECQRRGHVVRLFDTRIVPTGLRVLATV